MVRVQGVIVCICVTKCNFITCEGKQCIYMCVDECPLVFMLCVLLLYTLLCVLHVLLLFVLLITHARKRAG